MKKIQSGLHSVSLFLLKNMRECVYVHRERAIRKQRNMLLMKHLWTVEILNDFFVLLCFSVFSKFSAVNIWCFVTRKKAIITSKLSGDNHFGLHSDAGVHIPNPACHTCLCCLWVKNGFTCLFILFYFFRGGVGEGVWGWKGLQLDKAFPYPACFSIHGYQKSKI